MNAGIVNQKADGSLELTEAGREAEVFEEHDRVVESLYNQGPEVVQGVAEGIATGEIDSSSIVSESVQEYYRGKVAEVTSPYGISDPNTLGAFLGEADRQEAMRRVISQDWSAMGRFAELAHTNASEFSKTSAFSAAIASEGWGYNAGIITFEDGSQMSAADALLSGTISYEWED